VKNQKPNTTGVPREKLQCHGFFSAVLISDPKSGQIKMIFKNLKLRILNKLFLGCLCSRVSAKLIHNSQTMGKKQIAGEDWLDVGSLII